MERGRPDDHSEPPSRRPVMTRLLYLFRSVGAVNLLLAFVAFCLLCLWAGMVLGVAFVRTGSSFVSSSLMTAWMPEALRRNADDLLSVMPLTGAVLAAMHGGLPSRLARFATSIVQFLEECLKLPAGGHSWFGKPGEPGLMPSFVAPCPSLVVAAFLLGSYGAMPPEPARPPVTYVFSSDSMLSVLPIHLLVHFENAGIDAADELTERGTTLNDARRAGLEEVVEVLRPCAASDRPVTIRPYGFASDDPFPGDVRESDRLNVEAANRRARAAHDALAALIEPGMTIEAPVVWERFEEMANARNSMIRVPEGSDRDSLADRVVVLRLTSTGACRAVDPHAPSITAEPSAGTDTAPPPAASATFRSDSPVENTARIGEAKAAASENRRPA